MALGTQDGDQSRWAGAQNFYGGMDLERDIANGVSSEAIKANMAQNPGQFRSAKTIAMINALPSSPSKSSSGGGGGGGGGNTVGAGAGGFNPAAVNFNPGGIDMGGGGGPQWSNEDFIRGLARERAEEFTSVSNKENSITNNIEQNIGNKGDWETNIGDNNTIENSLIGNDYSLNMGSINLNNQQFS